MKRLFRFLQRLKGAAKPRKVILFRSQSGPDPLIVMERSGIRYLIIGRRTQSAYRPSKPDEIVHLYPRLMLAAFGAWPGHPEHRSGRVLVLGLGAGILPRHLATTYPHLQQLSVEIDPLVYDAAVRFFDFPGWLPVSIEDGAGYLSRSEVVYDAIFLDVFDGSYIPEAFLSSQFLRLCIRRLRANGLVIANLYEGSKTRDKESALWKEAFPGAMEIRNPERFRGNRIIVAGPGVPDSIDKFRNAAIATLVGQGKDPREVHRLLSRTMPLQAD